MPQNQASQILLHVSFNGCGFLGIYHVGVAAALRAYLPNMRFSVVCGASAGALAGVSLLGDVPPGETYSVPQYKYNMYYLT